MPDPDTKTEEQVNTETTSEETKDQTTAEETEQTTETKPTEETNDEPQGAPESYEKFKLAEGVEIDEELLGDFSSAAKEMNLTQENAQKLVDFGTRLMENAAAQTEQNRNDTLDAWEKEVSEDPDIGGDKLPGVMDRCRRVLKNQGSDELNTLLESTCLGSHPQVIKFLVKVDKALSEDRAVEGNADEKEVDKSDEARAGRLYDGK